MKREATYSGKALSKVHLFFRLIREGGILATLLLYLFYCVDYLFDIKNKSDKFSWGRIKEGGTLATLLFTLSYCVDYLFDMKYKTDTFSWVGLDALGIDDAKKEHAYWYETTHAVPLRKLFKALRIQPGKVLVDLGCGKGKVLLIASEFGFKEVRGVEISPLLCDIASNNCSIYKARTKTNTVFSIHKIDALDYGIKDDEDVFYLCDPFDAYILEQVLKNVLASLQKRKRKIWIIYHDAEYQRGMIEEKMNPTTVFDFTFWGKEFVVFEVEQGEIGMRRPVPPSRDALL